MKSRAHAVLVASLAVVLAAGGIGATAENIDPDEDGSQYAWGENVGWVNAEPSGNGGPGVEVTDSALSGWMWGENIGWISLSCQNTSSCATVDYGVTNDGNGGLAGFAWGENVGWISFSCANTASCGKAGYGVTIDPLTGEFGGRAWGENVGWISFASDGPSPFRMRTVWTACAAPAGSPALDVDRSGTDTRLEWSLPAATSYDVIRGDLTTLRASGGDFTAATVECLLDDGPVTSLLFAGSPGPGEGFWFLVRGIDCAAGTYDSDGVNQSGVRDAEIAASPAACP